MHLAPGHTGAHSKAVATSLLHAMSTIYAKHVTDVSRNLGPFDSVDEAITAVQASGGHVLKIDDWSSVVWSDHPRKQNPAPILNIPPIPLTLLSDRLTRG